MEFKQKNERNSDKTELAVDTRTGNEIENVLNW